MKSLGKGVFYGATDIVRQPIKEIKTENNIVGFGKGLLKGIGGVFTKPISGSRQNRSEVWRRQQRRRNLKLKQPKRRRRKQEEHRRRP